MTKDRRFMIVRDASNTNPLTNFIHARLNRAQGVLEIEPINKGKYNLYVTAENLVGISQPKLHEIVVANATYDDWTNLYWSPPTAEVAGFYADPDSDGLMNGLEFAMRLDPTVADPGPIPDYRFEGNEVIFTYTEDSTVELQVKLHPQVSADLQFWSDATPVELELVNGLRTMEVRIPIDEEKLFFRLWAEPLVPVLGQ